MQIDMTRWERDNTRRCDLIHKLVFYSLTPVEERELGNLQRQAKKVTQAFQTVSVLTYGKPTCLKP